MQLVTVHLCRLHHEIVIFEFYRFIINIKFFFLSTIINIKIHLNLIDVWKILTLTVKNNIDNI